MAEHMNSEKDGGARALALPLTYEVHQLSEGYSAIVYDARGQAIDLYLFEEQAAKIVRACNAHDDLVAALETLVDAQALAGVRNLVAGWNGEDRPEGRRYERHPKQLGATLPKTNCGAVYDLDDAMKKARAALSLAKGGK